MQFKTFSYDFKEGDKVGSSGLVFFLKYSMYFFLERGEGREKERERNINVREKR